MWGDVIKQITGKQAAVQKPLIIANAKLNERALKDPMEQASRKRSRVDSALTMNASDQTKINGAPESDIGRLAPKYS